MASLVILPDVGSTKPIEDKTVEASRAMIRELFESVGITDGWRMKPGNQVKGTPHFRLKLSPKSSYPLVIITRPFGNDSAWEWYLSPTRKHDDFDTTQNTLRCFIDAQAVKEEPPPPPPQVVTPPPAAPAVGLPAPLAEKLAKAQELVKGHQATRAEIERLEHELFELLEKQKLIEQQVQEKRAALENDAPGHAAIMFLESYQSLLEAQF